MEGNQVKGKLFQRIVIDRHFVFHLSQVYPSLGLLFLFEK